MSEPSIRDHSVSLFTFLREVVALRSKTVRSVDDTDYALVHWIADIPRETGCYCIQWESTPETAGQSDSWLVVSRPRSRTHPRVPPELEPWVDAYEVADSSREYPELKEEALLGRSESKSSGNTVGGYRTVSLEEMPAILDLWEEYVERLWQPWAAGERQRLKVQELYDDLFAAHQKLQTVAEEYELLVGFGLLSWKTPTGHVVKRPLITARCELSFDAARGRISIEPSPDGSLLRLEQDMLELGEQPSPTDAAGVASALEQVGDGFWHDDTLHDILRQWVHATSPQGEYDSVAGHPAPATDQLHVTWSPVVIMRRRTDRPILDLYDRILRYMKDGGAIPSGVKSLIEMDESRNGDSEPHDISAVSGGNDRIYFPLPANDEQFRIVERLAQGQGLLVQGPPGTGKSHTIANLITHLLATGQRVLVTSQTPRALRVLKEKLPPEIANLCVLLIGDDRAGLNDLEASVQAITDRFNSWDADASARTIARVETELDEAQRREAAIRRRLVTLREREVEPCSAIAGGYHGTLRQIAERLGQEREHRGWLKLNLAPVAAPQPLLSNDEAQMLLTLSRQEAGLSEPDRCAELPPIDRLPSASDFDALVAAERNARSKLARAIEEGIRSASVEALSKSSMESLEAARSAIQAFLRSLRVCASHKEDWCAEAVADVLSGRKLRWVELEASARRTVESTSLLPDSVYSVIVSGTEGVELADIRGDAMVLLEYLQAGGRLGTWLKRPPKHVRQSTYIVDRVRINGSAVDTVDELALLIGWCDLLLDLGRLDATWSSFIATPPGTEQLRLAAHRDNLAILAGIISLDDQLNEAKQAVSLLDGLVEPQWHSQQSLNDTLRLLSAATEANRLVEASEPLDRIERDIHLALDTTTPHPSLSRMQTAVSSRAVDQYAQSRRELAQLSNIRSSLGHLEQLRTRLQATSPATAHDLANDPADPAWDERMAEFEAAWSWALADRWIKDCTDAGVLSALLDEWDTVNDRARALLSTLAEAKAWAHCFTRLTEHERKYLMAWMQATRRIGKGTGKNAPRYRREARAHMNECRSAIPAWVMPIYRVAESFTPGNEQFDVVIVDEASQSGIEALFLQFIGKKTIIVGDNKQIAPEYIGTNSQAVQELRLRHIEDLPVSSEFTTESSLFDQASIHYRSSVRLTEHFRCMPEIIQFSNLLCYQNEPLIPLRQYGSDRLEPVRCIFVEDGNQEGASSQAVNRPEAQAVVEAIAHCCGDPRYDDCSMGVISLLGNSQSKLIERMLIRSIGAEALEKRRLVCGDAYSFQGDERDVIFLTMVSAPRSDHRIGVLASPKDERRFNVAASRAKNQLWLFHSATLGDLSPKCMRAKLLEYCMAPKVDPILANGEISVDDLKLQASDRRRGEREAPRPFGSWFEVDVFLRIVERGYRVAPQYEVAGYRIDLVVEGGQSRLAVECDGDQWHGAEQFEADMARQRQLERCGWSFWRIRGSEFYSNPENSLVDLWRQLERHQIHPHNRAPATGIAEAARPDPSESEAEGAGTPRMDSSGQPGESVTEMHFDEQAGTPGDSVPFDLTSRSAREDNREPSDAAVGLAAGWPRHPALGPLSEDNCPCRGDYVVAHPALDPGALSFTDMPPETLANHLAAVVAIEGPIHITEAARRVVRAAGIQRVGHVIEASFRTAAAQAALMGLILIRGDFLWSVKETDPVVRSRSSLPADMRKIDLISDEEIDWAVYLVLATEGRVQEGHLAQTVMREFGFERTSRDARTRVEAAVHRGVAANAIAQAEGLLTLAGSEMAEVVRWTPIPGQVC